MPLPLVPLVPLVPEVPLGLELPRFLSSLEPFLDGPEEPPPDVPEPGPELELEPSEVLAVLSPPDP